MLKIFISLEDRTKVRKGDRRVTSLCQNQLGEDKSCLKTLVAGADCRGRRPFLDRRRGSSFLGHVLDGLMLLHGLLPVAAIELFHHHAAHGALRQTHGLRAISVLTSQVYPSLWASPAEHWTLVASGPDCPDVESTHS